MFEVEDIAGIDDLIEALLRTGSAQDYPPPEALMSARRRGSQEVDRRPRD